MFLTYTVFHTTGFWWNIYSIMIFLDIALKCWRIYFEKDFYFKTTTKWQINTNIELYVRFKSFFPVYFVFLFFVQFVYILFEIMLFSIFEILL